MQVLLKKTSVSGLKITQSVETYIAAHPIAGTEFSGPEAALCHNLYENKTNIICEVEETAFKLQEKAFKLFADFRHAYKVHES
jgi:prephenate dehydrogenase